MSGPLSRTRLWMGFAVASWGGVGAAMAAAEKWQWAGKLPKEFLDLQSVTSAMVFRRWG